ncbi:hypothetical protein GCM10023258_32300 [Terrabacter aeriphilus]|uniref:Fibronectin type-III domain-containing protein n=1 Tax=Terrabacter aeriphilus TaxID=515662 RepID=A0ABP9JI40_9MICO
MLAAVIVVGLVPPSAGTAVAAPAATRGLTPSSGAASSATPVLGWQASVGARRYDVELSAVPDFSSILFTRSTTNTRLVPTVMLPDGDVFWRVRTVDAAGIGAWATSALAVRSTLPPTPKGPADGSSLAQPANPPLLSWTAVPGATSYLVDVDVDTDFVGASTYTTKTTSVVVPDARADGRYYWRVRAQLANGRYTAYSVVWGYSIGPLSQVTPSYPEDGAAVEDVVLSWNPVAGAKTYELQVSTDQDFNTLLDNKVNLKGTRYSPPTTYLNDQYYWRVRARNAQGETFDWQQVEQKRLVQRNWLDRPTLLHPADMPSPPTGDDFYFEWEPVQHATRYQLDLGRDPNFSPLSFTTCEMAGTTYTPAHLLDRKNCAPVQGGVYYWRVRAIDGPADVQGIYSEIHSFVYATGQVIQTAPADGASVSVPTLRWQAARDVEKYRVILTSGTGRVVADIKTYALSWTSDKALAATDGPYSWTVQSITADGRESPRYAPRRFELLENAPTTGALEALTPIGAGTATNRFPGLAWQPAEDAAYYRVRIGDKNSEYFYDEATAPILSTKYAYPAATDTSLAILKPGEYRWFVEAFSARNVRLAQGTTMGSFTITELAPVTGRRLAVTGTSLDAGKACTASISAPTTSPILCTDVPTTPVLDWDSVPDASYYMVYVARDRELTNLVYPEPRIPRVTGSRWTPNIYNKPMALPDSQAGQAYYWYIRPCKANGVCGPDPVSTLAAATNAFSKTSPPVSLTSPAAGAAVANQVTFSWQDYLTTNAASTYAATGERSTQTAMSYRIQVSQTRSFATLVDDKVVDQATYTAWDRTYPEGPLYWRVQAIDAAGNGLTWSVGDRPGQAGREFRKLSPAPVLRSPVGNAVTGGLSPFVWTPADFAGSYVLEVYRNDDTNWSPVNRVASVTGRQVAYAHGLPLPASSSAYVWRVARLDADNRPGQWSTTGRFFSTGTVPTQTSPAVGAAMSQSSPYFSWTAVPGGVTYRFERRAPGTTALAENVTTSAQAWAPTAALPMGAWEWRVVAVDANRADLGASAWRPFTAVGTLTLTPSPSVTGVVRVGSRLTAAPGTWTPAPVTLAYQWYRSGVAISGARSATYTLTASDLSQKVRVRVVGSKVGYASVARYSAETATVASGLLTPSPTPKVTGTVRVGSRLTATAGTWGPAPVTLSYQWFRSGVAVRGATTSSYLLGTADLGKTVRVAVTGRRIAFATLTRTSASTAPVAPRALTASPVPRVSGTARVGRTLTASAGTWGPSPVTLSYQWYRAGVAVRGATARTYVLKSADVSRTFTVRVTGRKTGYATTTRASAATRSVTR